MGKVILFADIIYTGRYRCYNIDDNVSTNEEVILFNNPDAPIELCSVLNIDTKYMMTLLFSQRIVDSKTSEKSKYLHM